jgi:hypothetical protein
VRRAAFQVTASVVHPGTYTHNIYANCPSCFYPLGAVVGCATNPTQLHGDLAAKRTDVVVQSIYPQRPHSKSPESVPDAAAKAFVEGAENLKDGRYTSAVAMFRRAIDVGTKQFSDDVTAWKLDKRIDKLAAEGLITKDLQAWAHKIRLEGNEAIHEIDEPTKEQAAELALFTEMVLTYLYTLPAKVKANLPKGE